MFFLNRTGSYDDQQHLLLHSPIVQISVWKHSCFTVLDLNPSPLKWFTEGHRVNKTFIWVNHVSFTFKCILIDHDPKLNTEKEFLVNGEGRVSLPLSIEKSKYAGS